MAELTPKQRLFVAEYLKDLNATQAAIRAGYSEKTAYAQGARLLTNAEIAAAIDHAKIERSEKTKIDANWVLDRLALEAEADIADIYYEDGAVKPVHEWPKIWRQGLVAGIKHQELRDSEGNRTGEFIVDVKISDRIRRIELIGKHVRVNAFQDIVEHKGLDALADRMERAAKALRDG
ncbi:terminase [Rhizobium sp. 58]|nr:terminase [Rhizobium sp. 58]